jgi:hypothetical protein
MYFGNTRYCASNLFYTVMDPQGLVVDFYVATKEMVGYSAEMGMYGL